MGSDPLDYHHLLQDALRGLVRRCLEIVAEEGLPGEHHFYLSFRTGAPGVDLPHHLRERYPDEMTIVLKTKFKDLSVGGDAFSVGLFFGGILHYLTIPLAALTSFTDPAAGFQLAFQGAPPDELASAAGEGGAGEPTQADGGGTDAGDNVVSISRFRRKE